MSRVTAEYLLETPFPPADVAATMAGEQSSGTFVRVAGETDALRARSAAEVLSVEPLGDSDGPTLASAYLDRKGVGGPYHLSRVRIAYPTGNIGKMMLMNLQDLQTLQQNLILRKINLKLGL